MEIRIVKNSLMIAFGTPDDKDLVIHRKLHPSPLSEVVILRPKKRRVEIYFLIEYGELTLLKAKLKHISLKNFERIINRIESIIDRGNNKKLKKYCENKLREYERELFYLYYRKRG